MLMILRNAWIHSHSNGLNSRQDSAALAGSQSRKRTTMNSKTLTLTKHIGKDCGVYNDFMIPTHLLCLYVVVLEIKIAYGNLI